MTTVVNIHYDAYDVYIGRAGHGFDGYFGNPYSAASRTVNIQFFESYFYGRVEKDPLFRARVLALKGKRLGCFCKPKACHGEVIAEYLNTQP